jgi:hypothetical protein
MGADEEQEPAAWSEPGPALIPCSRDTDHADRTGTQRTEVTSMLARDDEVAVEAIWTGVLKGDMGPLKAGDTLRIYTAYFFIFRDGKIAVQRTYNCVDAPMP